MELLVNNEQVDLSSGLSATVDYELFSDKVENLVSTVKGLDVPSTPKNEGILTAGEKHDAELTSEFGRSFVGKINVDSRSFNAVDDTISMTFFERLKELFDSMGDDTIEVLSSDLVKFDWNWNKGSGIPTEDNKDGWFLTAGDFNDYSDGGEDMEKIPLYPAKVISNKNQAFWTISLYKLFKKVFEYYQIDYNLSSGDYVFDDVTFGELFVFIPVTKFVCTDRDLEKRYCSLGAVNDASSATDDGYFQFISNQDGLEQTKLRTSSGGNIVYALVGATDTKYKIRVVGNVSYGSYHWKSGGLGNVPVPTGVDNGSVDVVLQVLVSDVVVKNIVVKEFENMTSSGINDSGVVGVFEEFEYDLKSADQLRVRIAYVFNAYSFYDTNGTVLYESDLKTISGTYTYEQLDDICESVLPPRVLVGTLLNTFVVSANPIDQLVPVRREFQFSDIIVEDEISVKDSLEHTEIRVKDLLQDITKRYNLFYWIDSNNDIRVSNYEGRYNVNSTVSLYESDGERYTLNYKIDYIGKFSYKNSIGSVVPLVIDDDNSIGDVKETELGTGDNDISVSLNSSVASQLVYGEKIEPTDDYLYDLVPDAKFWGISGSEQLEPSSIPIMHGFLSDDAPEFDARLNHIITFNLGDETDPDWQPLTYYTPNGGKYGSKKSPSMPTLHYPVRTNGIKSVMLGDEDAELDTSSKMYDNFGFLFDIDQSTITIEGILSHSRLDLILDGALVKIADIEPTEVRFKVLSIEGFVFDQEYSVVSLKLKKYIQPEIIEA